MAPDPPIPGLAIPAIRPHDYVWFRYEDYVSHGRLAKRPSAAYVVQVYPDGDFRRLNL